MTENKTSLIAHTEHIVDDIEAVFPELSDDQIAKFAEFVESYMRASIESVLEFPEWYSDSN